MMPIHALMLFLEPVTALGSPAGLTALVGAVLFAWFTVRRGSLSPDGAVAAVWTGLWVFFFAGPLWLLPLFFFFISSTLLGRLSRRGSVKSDEKHGKARDYKQVLCNGGLYALLAGYTDAGSLPLWLMAVSMAVSTADTWSSEYGIFRRGATYDLLRLRPVPAGVSGGVSAEGTLAGLAGAFCIGALSAWLGVTHWWSVVLAGFAGMLLDSALGAGLQARYGDPADGTLSDHAAQGARLYSGLRFVSNDGVNLLSNVLITAGAALWWFTSN